LKLWATGLVALQAQPVELLVSARHQPVMPMLSLPVRLLIGTVKETEALGMVTAVGFVRRDESYPMSMARLDMLAPLLVRNMGTVTACPAIPVTLPRLSVSAVASSGKVQANSKRKVTLDDFWLNTASMRQ
jgi:hypothetical protein